VVLALYCVIGLSYDIVVKDSEDDGEYMPDERDEDDEDMKAMNCKYCKEAEEYKEDKKKTEDEEPDERVADGNMFGIFHDQ